ncbi:MAG: element excision factor XisI family protein [Aggregatilineales bacterium]
MERVINGTLTAILRQEIKKYAVDTITPAGGSKFYYTENPKEQVFCVTAPHTSAEMYATLIIMARIVEDQIVIDIDKTNKPLSDALQQAGVPGQQIVLAWQGN